MKAKTVQSSAKSAPWWQDFFQGGFFRPFFDTIPPRRALAEVRFIMKALDLKKGDSLLDICCGIGRHLIPLARRGIKTTGVDLCLEFTQEWVKNRGEGYVSASG
jgi:ubiquinone/menaquinone biosynthesis C-methylase UbiE